jgi:DNA repair exonuclease SbcCD ATPase subunit
VRDLEDQLSTIMSNTQAELRLARSSLESARGRQKAAEMSIEKYGEQIAELEKKQSEIPVLQATLLSRRRVYDQLDGEPHLVWVDRHATSMHGPVFPVFPTAEPPGRTLAESAEDDEL